MTGYSSSAWCLPGGKIDYGQTVEEAVAGELREETSLECRGTKFLFHEDSLPPVPSEMHCLNLYFECAVPGSMSRDDGSSQFAWIGPADLENYQIAFRNGLALQRYWDERARDAVDPPEFQDLRSEGDP